MYVTNKHFTSVKHVISYKQNKIKQNVFIKKIPNYFLKNKALLLSSL